MVITKSEFDYSQLDSNVAEFLKQKSTKICGIVGRVNYELGKELKDAQDELSKHGYGCFEEWYESIGLKKQTVYNYINAYSFVQLLDNQNKEELSKELPADLMYEAGKPNADPEIVQAVIDGKVTSKKQFKELEKIKENLDKKDNREKEEKSKPKVNNAETEVKDSEQVLQNDSSEESSQYDDVIVNIADSLQNLIEPFKKILISEKLSMNQLTRIGALTHVQQEQLTGVLTAENMSDLYFSSILPTLHKLSKYGIDGESIKSCYSILDKIFNSDMSAAFDLIGKLTDEFLMKVKELKGAEIDLYFWELFSEIKEANDKKYEKFKNTYGSSFSGNSDFEKTIAKSNDPYQVLGISKDASEEEAKKRYQQLIKIFHPDIAKAQKIEGTEFLFILIKEAYETIKKSKGEI